MAFRSRRTRRSRRRFTSRRRFGGRPTMRRRPMTSGRVRRIIDAELKYHILTAGGQAPSFVGDSQPLTELITQGDGVTQRNGNWIKPVNIHGTLRVTAVNDPGAISPVVDVRAMVIRWNEDLSVNPPTLAHVVNDPSAPGGQFNFENKGQFKVMWTKNFTLVNDDDNSQFTKLFKVYIRLSRSPKTLFDGAALAKKFHYIFYIFSDTNAAGEIPSYQIDFVTRYTDS